MFHDQFNQAFSRFADNSLELLGSLGEGLTEAPVSGRPLQYYPDICGGVKVIEFHLQNFYVTTTVVSSRVPVQPYLAQESQPGVAYFLQRTCVLTAEKKTLMLSRCNTRTCSCEGLFTVLLSACHLMRLRHRSDRLSQDGMSVGNYYSIRNVVPRFNSTDLHLEDGDKFSFRRFHNTYQSVWSHSV
jgi:hypothetical protein